MDPRLIVLLGGVYTEEAEDEDKDERRIEGEGNGFGGGGEGNGFGGGGGGWGWIWGWERPCDESAGIAAIDIASAEETKATWWWEEMIHAASLYLYFSISALIAFSSACKVWTCCCKADIAPMHPYTGSLSLKLAS